MFKRLLIWIMLIALPLQSYAAASMIYCAPNHHGMAASSMADEHSQHAHHHDAGATDDHSGKDHTPQKSADKCSACSSCCLGTGATSAFKTDIATPSGSPVLVSHPIDAFASVIPEGLQRPPRNTSLS